MSRDELLRAQELLQEQEAQYRAIFEASRNALIISDRNRIVVEVNEAACLLYGYSREEFVGLPTSAITHPDSRADVAEAAEAINEGSGSDLREIGLRKDGSSFHAELRARPVLFKGELHRLAVIRDITEQVTAYKLLEERVAERTHELAALLEVSRNLTLTLELRPLLASIVEQIGSIIGFTGASVMELVGDDLRIIYRSGPGSSDIPAQPVASVAAAPWNTLALGACMLIDDVRSDTPAAREYRRVNEGLIDTVLAYVRAWMGIPMMLNGRLIGVLSLASESPSAYTSRHVALALAFAQQAANAIENARLYEKAQRVAALEERQRLARELHDSVSQALYGIALGARTARTLLDREPARAAEPLDYVLEQAEAGLTEMRALIFELRPESLETEGLVAALNKQTAAVRARFQVEVREDLCSEPAVSLEVKEALYRIAREALHNAAKHAAAKSVHVRLTAGRSGIALEVQDDGCGFNSDGSFPGHLGLQSMRERAASVNGMVEVVSAPTSGTLVRVHIPASGGM